MDNSPFDPIEMAAPLGRIEHRRLWGFAHKHRTQVVWT